MGKLQDKVALITGSDSGIGHATAIEFAREGADVIVHYLHDEQGANSTREQVEAQGRRRAGGGAGRVHSSAARPSCSRG
jgi:glucose 1-dehydrogenase